MDGEGDDVTDAEISEELHALADNFDKGKLAPEDVPDALRRLAAEIEEMPAPEEQQS